MIGSASNRRLWVLAALAAMLAGGPAFAQGHGGGSGGRGGGNGGGGAPRMGGMREAPAFGGAPRFSGAPHSAGSPALGGGTHFATPSRSVFAGAHVGYAPRPGVAVGNSYVTAGGRGYVGGGRGYVPGGQGYVAGDREYVAGGHVAGDSGYVTGHTYTGAPGAWHTRPGYAAPGYGRPGYYAHWRPAYGGYGRYWGGGYWHGTFWPRLDYGWGFPLFLPVLPAVYATYYWGGIPYYCANDVYYTWNSDENGYVVTNPPPVAGTVADNSGDHGQSGGGLDIYAYPENGQTEEQQSNDRYECHTWARSQTGFDPTESHSTGNADDYRRAMVACLSARGYSAR